MKTLKLTNDQVATILQALGIAEKQFNNIHKSIIDTINVRGNETNRHEQREKADQFFQSACVFADLNDAIKKGEADV